MPSPPDPTAERKCNRSTARSSAARTALHSSGQITQAASPCAPCPAPHCSPLPPFSQTAPTPPPLFQEPAAWTNATQRGSWTDIVNLGNRNKHLETFTAI